MNAGEKMELFRESVALEPMLISRMDTDFKFANYQIQEYLTHSHQLKGRVFFLCRLQEEAALFLGLHNLIWSQKGFLFCSVLLTAP